MTFNWFVATETERFGSELASFSLEELKGSADKRDATFAIRVNKVLQRAAQRVQEFSARETMNVYKQTRLANAFLWVLKRRRLFRAANQLTDWLTRRL